MKEIKTESGYSIQVYDSVDYSMFPNMEKIGSRIVKDSDDDTEGREVTVTVLQKEKTYNWLRVHIDESFGASLNIKKGDVVKMEYLPFGEVFELEFASFDKKGLFKNKIDIVNYESENDTSVICLMVDTDELYKHENIRQLFSWSKYYEFNIIRKDELIFRLPDGSVLDYNNLEL